MNPDFWLFAAVGFAAQLVDGALGMAYGVISSTVLLSLGVSPANASASVHAAKVFTGAASGLSHILYRNVDWKLLALLSKLVKLLQNNRHARMNGPDKLRVTIAREEIGARADLIRSIMQELV